MSKQITNLTMALAFLATISTSMSTSVQDDALRALNGAWLFVEDRTEGRSVEEGQAPMSARFSLRVEKRAFGSTESRYRVASTCYAQN